MSNQIRSKLAELSDDQIETIKEALFCFFDYTLEDDVEELLNYLYDEE